MEERDPSPFGHLLRRYRVQAGLTQEELAERALISARAISDLERGVNRAARQDTIRQLAEALQLSPEEREALEAAARERMVQPTRREQPADDAGSRVRTFLIADLRGYTSWTREHGDHAAAELAERFADVVERTVAQWEGQVVELRGDEALAVFLSARQALRAATELLARCEEMAQAGELPLKLGIGLDAGEAIPVKGGYRGLALNLAARLCAFAGRDDERAWGEVFASEAVIHLAGRLEGVAYLDRGPMPVKGFADPVRVFQAVRERGARTDTAPAVMPAQTASPVQVSQKDASESDTFLMADIRGWTLFSLEHGAEAAARVADRFGEIVDGVVAAREGRVVSVRGDDAFAVFSAAPQALGAAVELQERFARQTETDPSLPLRAGIGLETGGAVPLREGYVGTAVDLAAQLCSLAGAGEILVSEAVTRAVRPVDDMAYVKRGLTELKGFADPVQVFQVVAGADRPAPGKATAPQETAIVQPAERHRVPSECGPRPIGRFLGSLPSGSLVGRNEELSRVLAPADAVTEGEGRLIVLAGEPGAGKTRLAQEAMLVLRNRDFLVATGRCYEPEQSVPYYPFLDALMEAYRAAPAGISAEVPQRWPHLGRLLPDVASLGGQADTGGRDEQQLLFRAVTGFLGAVAQRTPLALLLDDLHWVDDASLKLLLHLARHSRSARLLLLGTYRDVEIGRDHPLQRGLLDLDREGLVERVAIRRMDEAGTGALVANIMGEADIPRELTELVYARTDGNPFFVQQVLRTLVERGEVYREDGRWLRREIAGAEVPESVRGVIRQRVRRLREATWDMLGEASVLGQMFRFDDLQRLAERGEEELDVALEEAGSAGLVREAGRDMYAFDHVLTQQALYADLSARRKRKLHLAAGEALEQLPERQREQRAAELAWHFQEGGDPGRALPYAILAGDQAEMVYAHAEAERQYRTALGLAREIEDEDHEREVMEKLGRLLELTARYDEALGFLEGAAKLYRSVVDREGEARVVGLLGRLHHSRDQYEEGAARIQTLLEELEDAPPSPGLVSLWSALASIRFAEGRNQETLVAAQRATDCARAVGDNRLLAEAEERRGLALSMAGQPQAREVLENAARLAESVGDLTTLGRALNNLSAMPYEAGEVETARSFEERALQVAERNGDVQLVNLIGIKLSDDALGRGQWSQARADLERVRDVLRRMDASSQTGYPLIGLARLSRAEGRWEEAYRSLKEATALAERDGDRPLMWAVQFELAALDLEQGRAETAAVRLRTRLDEANLNKYLHANLLANLAEAHLRMGDVAGAEELASESVERAAALMQGSFLVWPFRVKGMVLAEQGRWDEAEVAFEQALALTRKMEAVYREGRILYEYGIMYARKGEPERARDLLEAALGIFRGLGARPHIERTEQALARALEEDGQPQRVT